MRILVVQTAFLGDVVMTTPLLRALRSAHPGASIDAVAVPAGAGVLEGSPYVDLVIVFDKKGRDRGAAGTWRLLRRIAAGRYDVALAAQRSFRTGLVVAASRAPLRIGFAGAAGAWAYSRRVPWRKDQHAIVRYLDLARAAGGDEGADPRPEMPVVPAARGRAIGLLRDAGVADGAEILAIAPGSQWATKRWMPEGFAEVARRAKARGLVPVFLGGAAERPLCAAIAEACGGAPNLAGQTSIADLAALVSLARALVTNDSGPGHVASAVGTPVVAVFGPTVPAMGYVPWGEANRVVERRGLECRPCSAHGPEVCPLGHHRCMQDVPAEAVFAAVASVLAPGQDRRAPG